MRRNAVISSHVLMHGAAHALRDYLSQTRRLDVQVISLPLASQKYLSVERIKNGKSKQFDQRKKLNIPLIEYLYEFCYVVFHTINYRKKIDFFYGIDPLNALAGIILKRIGKVDKVIFYGIDFVPKRFNNIAMNFIFHELEKIAVKNSDFVWNVSPRMAEGRRKFLGINERKYKQMVVPIGVDRVLSLRSKTVFYKMIFIGHILEKQGLQLLLQALPTIIKQFPQIRLTIIGGGYYEDELKKIVVNLRLKNNVEFRGWVEDRSTIKNEMLKSDLGIACYKPEKSKQTNFTYYADPTKIKDYLSFGLPVLTTNVPYNAYEIENAGCGIVVDYNQDSLAKAIIDYYSNKDRIIESRKNAYKYIKHFTWSDVFNKATYEIF